MNTNLRRRALLFSLFMLVCICILVYLIPRSTVNGSVLTLLPRNSIHALNAEIEQELISRLDRQVVFLTGGKVTPDTVRTLVQDLKDTGGFASVTAELNRDFQEAYGKALFENRTAFLTRDELETLAHPETMADAVLVTLVGSFSGVSAQEITHDPFLFMRNFQMRALNNTSLIHLDNHFLTVAGTFGETWYFISAQTYDDAYSLTESRALVAKLNALKERYAAQGVNILSRGTLFYSVAAADSAQSDLTVLGSVTVILVFLLIGVVFRSLLPVALVVLSVLCGAIVALTFTLLIFREVHLITLTLCVSIVGVAVDYSLYYLTTRLTTSGRETPAATLRRTQKAIVSALLTTLIAYLCLTAAPFPGVRQMALFAMAGLIGACLCVLCLTPLLSVRLRRRHLPARDLIVTVLNQYLKRPRFSLTLIVTIALISVVGLIRLDAHDDVREFQAMPLNLTYEEARITNLTGQSNSQVWLCVSAPDDETLLQKMESVRPALYEAVAAGEIGGFKTISLNSEKTQRETLKLIEKAFPVLEERLQELSLTENLSSYPTTQLSMDGYLASPLSLGLDRLYVRGENSRAILVLLDNLRSTEGLQAFLESRALYGAEDNGVSITLIDRKAAFDELFNLLRVKIGTLLGAALLIITFLFMVRHGLKEGLRQALPCLIAVLFAVGLNGLLGFTFNFFSLLALILVIGMGVNYALFFTLSHERPATATLAVTLAMLTTLTTLGVLVFSGTAAIRSFGFTLCAGLFAAFVLAPTVLKPSGPAGVKHLKVTRDD